MNTYNSDDEVPPSADLAKRIVRKIEAINKHRQQMADEFRELRALLEADGRPEYELRQVDEYRTVARHMLNYELVFELDRWESALVYRTQTEKEFKSTKNRKP